MSVLIVGAGPAGARLAIQLAREGVEVTLVDRLADPHRHAYSSGALPLEAVRRLGLPDDAISATWQGWQLRSSHHNYLIVFCNSSLCYNTYFLFSESTNGPGGTPQHKHVLCGSALVGTK